MKYWLYRWLWRDSDWSEPPICFEAANDVEALQLAKAYPPCCRWELYSWELYNQSGWKVKARKILDDHPA